MKVTLSADMRYGDGERLWPAEFEEHVSTAFSWGNNNVSFGMVGARIQTSVDLPKKQLKELVRKLVSLEPQFTPAWQTVPPSCQPLLMRAESQLLQAAQDVDAAIRQVSAGIRLPLFKFSRAGPNQSQQWPVMYWNFSDADRAAFASYLDKLEEPAKSRYSKGLTLPFPPANEGRQVHLTAEERQTIGEILGKEEVTAVPASFGLWSMAWDNFERHAYPAAVIVLASAIETAIKFHLGERGDRIASYLVENLPSPPLPKLLACAEREADLDVPSNCGTWLTGLMNKRNDVVHKPSSTTVSRLELARWFAVGEAILQQLNNHESEALAGFIVEISPKIGDFAKGSSGVVLRRSIDYGTDESLHVMLESGDTRRFQRGDLTVPDKQTFTD